MLEDARSHPRINEWGLGIEELEVCSEIGPTLMLIVVWKT